MTTIKLKNGSGAPTAGDLAQGEPALDLTNKRLYTEDSGGTVIEVGTNPGTDVTFADDRKAVFGAGSDLQIYHDGSNSYITDSGTGNLRISGTLLQLNDASFNKYLLGSGDSVTLYNADSAKLATTSTGIDVTGSISADGLTVDGATDGAAVALLRANNNGITKKNTLRFEDTDTTTQNDQQIGRIEFYSNDTDHTGVDAVIEAVSATTALKELRFLTSETANTPLSRLAINKNGDISFYEDTGTTAKLFWDASAESLGIGTSSPSSFSGDGDNLVVGTTSGNNGISIISATDGSGNLYFGDTATTGGGSRRGQLVYDHATDSMRFATAVTEAMRIDSSGNLLVGATTTTNLSDGTGNDGVQLNPSGTVAAARTSNVTAVFNRLSTDGEIARFNKDGSTVGSIGSNSGLAYYAGADIGIKFSSTQLRPSNSSGNNLDDTVDLGKSDTRFKDLYLSGGAYLGGTGSANKLDDYEEGTYVATLTPSTSGSITLNTSFDTLSYTKVGRIVSIVGRVRVSSVSSPVGTYVRVSLPFNIATGSEDDSRVTGSVVVQQAAQDIDKYCIHPKNGTSYIEIGRTDNFASNAANDFDGNELVAFNFTYIPA